MTNDEIVRALRVCNRAKGHRCSECPIFSRYEYGVCKRTVDLAAADLIEQLNDFEHSQCAKLLARIAQLEAQLAESQRREQAEVEFIKYLDRNYSGYMAEDERFTQWRGPQEAGKGVER